MSSLGNIVERGGSILVHCGGIAGSWRMDIEFSLVEEHSVWGIVDLYEYHARYQPHSQFSQNLLRALLSLPHLLVRILPHLYTSLTPLQEYARPIGIKR